jgi:hypothetical protein
VKCAIPREVLVHIVRRHGRDFSRLLGINSLDSLKRLLEDALVSPDEVRLDTRSSDVRYFLKKVNGLWLMVVVLEDEVKTAYLISPKTYKRFSSKRWARGP